MTQGRDRPETTGRIEGPRCLPGKKKVGGCGWEPIQKLASSTHAAWVPPAPVGWEGGRAGGSGRTTLSTQCRGDPEPWRSGKAERGGVVLAKKMQTEAGGPA